MPIYIGVMSGTSMDSVDAVVASIEPDCARVLGRREHPIADDLRAALTASLDTANLSALEFWRLDARLGELFADSVLALLAEQHLASSQIAAIGCHGQTLYHAPDEHPPLTIQGGDPNIIASRTGITTIADFRRRDLAVGGQGAPLAPGFHRAVFAQRGERRAIVNIGGIANVTLLGDTTEAPVLGFDCGPGNTLLDQWCQRHTGRRYDRDGAWADSGEVCAPLLEKMLDDPYFSRHGPKSTGREYFNMDWLTRMLQALPGLAAARDVQRTLVELTARTIAAGASNPEARADAVYLCGGGALNSLLLATVQRCLGNVPVLTTEALGVHPKDVEALAFAWLAHRTLRGEPGNLPDVTGARRTTVLGAIHPRDRD